jgi:hypothetical protein
MSSPFPPDPGLSTGQEPESGSAPDQEIPWYEREVHPMTQRSQAAFRRDLPQLMKKYKGRWVAYNGDLPVAIGRSKHKLYQQCLDEGLDEDEFVVRFIQPELPEDQDWDEFGDI